MAEAKNLVSLTKSEHISPEDTGDNISAKRGASYSWDGSNWQRSIFGVFSLPYDELDWSNADSGGNYQTIVSKLNGTTQQTLTLTYDGNNKVTKISRA